MEYPLHIKKRTITRAKAEAWTPFAQYIKIRDSIATTGTTSNSLCITCEEMPERKGTVYAWSALNAGHFIAGRGDAYLFNEFCVNAQCVHCNNNGGEGAFYERAMLKKYGKEITDSIMLLRHKPRDKKFTVFELYDIEMLYKKMAGDLLKKYANHNQRG